MRRCRARQGWGAGLGGVRVKGYRAREGIWGCAVGQRICLDRRVKVKGSREAVEAAVGRMVGRNFFPQALQRSGAVQRSAGGRRREVCTADRERRRHASWWLYSRRGCRRLSRRAHLAAAMSPGSQRHSAKNATRARADVGCPGPVLPPKLFFLPFSHFPTPPSRPPACPSPRPSPPPHAHTPKKKFQKKTTMAKGLRASSKKANRSKLRARVFGPVEQARVERLHAKLLETIQQPKPESNQMDTTEDGKLVASPCASLIANLPPASAANETTTANDDDLPKGSSFLTAPIPRSLFDPSPKSQDSAQDDCDLRNLCFHLGLCSDVVGFTPNGDLKFAFDPLPHYWPSKNQGLTPS